jgi:hypothetical protein
MFRDFRGQRRMLEPFRYADHQTLLRCLESDVIAPAEERAKELTGRPVSA